MSDSTAQFQFRTVMRGYEPSQVDRRLAEMTAALAAAQVRKQLGEVEATSTKTRSDADRYAAETRAAAERDAARLLQDAKRGAEQLLDEANRQANTRREEAEAI